MIAITKITTLSAHQINPNLLRQGDSYLISGIRKAFLATSVHICTNESGDRVAVAIIGVSLSGRDCGQEVWHHPFIDELRFLVVGHRGIKETLEFINE